MKMNYHPQWWWWSNHNHHHHPSVPTHTAPAAKAKRSNFRQLLMSEWGWERAIWFLWRFDYDHMTIKIMIILRWQSQSGRRLLATGFCSLASAKTSQVTIINYHILKGLQSEWHTSNYISTHGSKWVHFLFWFCLGFEAVRTQNSNGIASPL